MNLLVVGSGGREHALVRKLAGDAPGATIYCAPGNPGTAQHGINVPIRPGDLSGLTRFARAESIDLTVVGPEQPLADGLADAFIALGLPIFGPVAAAARLEASKAFSKRLMEESPGLCRRTGTTNCRQSLRSGRWKRRRRVRRSRRSQHNDL